MAARAQRFDSSVSWVGFSFGFAALHAAIGPLAVMLRRCAAVCCRSRRKFKARGPRAEAQRRSITRSGSQHERQRTVAVFATTCGHRFERNIRNRLALQRDYEHETEAIHVECDME